MSDESVAGEDPGVEAEEQPEQDALTGAESEGQALEALTDDDGAEDQSGEDLIEFDIGGTKVHFEATDTVDSVAERLQDFATSLYRDYTSNKETLAEQRKQLEAAETRSKERAEVVEKLESLQGEAFQTFSLGLQLKQEIAQLEAAMGPNGALYQSDPDRARQVSDLLSQKRAQLGEVTAKVSQQEAAFQTAKSQDTEKRMSEGREAVTSKVKDFDPDAVTEYVVTNYGISREDAATWPLNPAAAVMAHKAMLFDRMQQRAARPAKKPVSATSPAKGNGQRRRVNLNDAQTSSKDWFAAREKQLKAQRR